jgi:uncharacterized repeat protein (TIGR01451 family)
VTVLLLANLASPAAHAEGSRNLYPNGATGFRANLEWRTSSYGPTTPINNSLRRRMLLKVYANANEYILMGSSAKGIGSGDILVYNPGLVTGRIGAETFPANPSFRATSQATRGRITSRTQELAGPRSITGGGNPNGYVPAFYRAPVTGIYDVVFYGTAGANSDADGGPTGQIGLTSGSNFNSTQGTSVAAWDVTVRATQNTTTDRNGRLFCYYLTLFTGDNGRPVNATFYPVTLDGYRYETFLNGLDPNGFLNYGNLIGFLDSDGLSPLYRDLMGSDAQLTTVQGGCSFALPQYPIFFNNTAGANDANTVIGALGIPLVPTAPVVSGANFTGTAGSGGTTQGAGGTFQFDSNIPGIYEIVISIDGTNFDPTHAPNRALRGVMTAAGTQTVVWDGKDNVGANFPIGLNYQARLQIRAGEYHFPLIDAENSTLGGPRIRLMNANNILGATTAFYDDRGYRTLNGTFVTQDGTVATLNQPLCGVNPPNPARSNYITGFDTSTNQRRYGTATGGNTNVPCTGSFGDTKGLDIWTFFPSQPVTTTINVYGSANLILVKRITAINGTPIPGFVDDPADPNDTHPYWPVPNTTYLRGQIMSSQVRPGDEVEYTVYFLSSGNTPLTSVTLCDVLPAGVLFVDDAYTGLTPTDGGVSGADSGIALALNPTALPTAPTVYLSNIPDGDRGQFFPPGTPAPPAANPPGFATPLPGSLNVSGVVCVEVVRSPTPLPNATGAGVPPNAYGFVRFRVRVD